MKKQLLFTISFFIISLSYSQTNRGRSKGMTIYPCTETIGIATKNNLSGLWSYKTNSLFEELDSSLYQYYPNKKCLIKIRPDDSLLLFDMSYGQPEFLFASKEKMRVDVINDSLITYRGKTFFLGGNIQVIPKNVFGQGEFGVELLGNTAIIIDYKLRERESLDPMKYGKAGYSQGGVRDRTTKKWVIKPCANWIVKGHSTYVVEKTQFMEGNYNIADSMYYSIYNHQGKIMVDRLSENQLLGNPEYLRMMVPFYQADSVYAEKPYISFMLPGRIYFKYKGKTGYFNLTSNYVDQKPVDFLNNSFGNVRTIIDEDSILFRMYYDANELTFDLKAGDSYAFYPVKESHSHRDHGNFRIKRNGTDSVYILHYEPYSNSKRSITKVNYESSYLKSLIEEPYRNDDFTMNLLWRYAIEIYENDVINVTSNKLEFIGDPPKYFSGIFDLKKHKWIIENKYHSIVRTDKYYIAYPFDPKKDNSKFDKYGFDGVLIPN